MSILKTAPVDFNIIRIKNSLITFNASYYIYYRRAKFPQACGAVKREKCHMGKKTKTV